MKENNHSFPFRVMGSDANEIRLVSKDPAWALGASKLAQQEISRIESKYSRYLASSVISRINANAGIDWVECDDETLSLLAYAKVLYSSSNRLFDLTAGVLRAVWDFKVPELPSRFKLEECLALVGFDFLLIQGNRVFLEKRGMEIDLGGIGKEYAADRAAARLIDAGAHSGFVNLAGDLAVIGPQAHGEPWSISIPKPRAPLETLASIPVTRGGLATSGDYERYFDLNGKRYCHILNPISGYPVSYWQSITVLAATTSVAGSCSTIAMLLEEKGLAFLREGGLQFLAVDAQGKVHTNND